MLDTMRPCPIISPIDYLRWEALRGPDIVDRATREAIAITEADVASLLDFLEFEDCPLFIDAEDVGRDLYRLLGDDGYQHFAMWLVVKGGREEYSEAYANGCWGTFKREWRRGDRLMIDIMDDVRAYGWQPSAEIVAAIERLQDIAAAIRNAEEAAVEAAHQAKVDVRLALEAEAEAEQAAMVKRIDDASGDDTPQETYETACAQFDVEWVAWIAKYGVPLWPEKYDPACIAAARKEQEQLRDDAQVKWLALGPTPAPEQVEAWKFKFRKITLPFEKALPVTVIPFPTPVQPAALQADLIQTSAEFLADFKAPDYLVDGIFQRGYFYSVTAATGVGKTALALLVTAHVSEGRSIGGLDVTKGSIIYCAGENPNDVQMRWMAITRDMGIDPTKTDVHFVNGVKAFSQVGPAIAGEIARKNLTPALVVIDTSAAYFEGDNENDNAQQGMHARRLRWLTTLPGGPCVLVLCHPTKNANDDMLVPRGGGSFIAEVDGNVALRRTDTLISAGALGKFRGPEFPPLNFECVVIRDHPRLLDSRGRNVPTVIARMVDADGAARLERTAESDAIAVLRMICRDRGKGASDLARGLRWFRRAVDGKPPAPHHMRVVRAVAVLKADKLVEERLRKWYTTTKGEKELNEMDRRAAAMQPPPNSVILPPTRFAQPPN